MASDGSRGPKPFRQVTTSTVFLRVPVVDWPAVVRGLKREFRTNTKALGLLGQTPTPVVAYKVDHQGRYDHRLMICEDAWLEELGSISPDSLAREGFQTFSDFRDYWCRRERRRFTPTRRVFVHKVRPWREGDSDAMAEALLDRLYGDFLSTSRDPRATDGLRDANDRVSVE